MTALQIVNAVLKRLRQDEIAGLTAPPAYVADVIQCINAVQNELWHEKNWSFLKKTQEITLVEGTQGYAVAQDFGRMVRLYRNDPWLYELNYLSDDEWIKETYNRKDKGAPYIYRFFGVNSVGMPMIQVYYVPDGTYNGKKIYLDYISKVNDLTSDNDKSPFDESILIQGAFCKMKANDGDLDPKTVQDYERARSAYISSDSRQRMRKVIYRDF